MKPTHWFQAATVIMCAGIGVAIACIEKGVQAAQATDWDTALAKESAKADAS